MEVEADDVEEICDLDLAAAMECARMWPARARGLAKRREHSLHVFLAMARGSLESLMRESSVGRAKNTSSWWRRESERELLPPLPPWGS